jgi:hypothetical protein
MEQSFNFQLFLFVFSFAAAYFGSPVTTSLKQCCHDTLPVKEAFKPFHGRVIGAAHASLPTPDLAALLSVFWRFLLPLYRSVCADYVFFLNNRGIDFGRSKLELAELRRLACNFDDRLSQLIRISCSCDLPIGEVASVIRSGVSGEVLVGD